MSAAGDELRALISGRRMLLCGSAAGSKRLAHGLRRAGAEEVSSVDETSADHQETWRRTMAQEHLLTHPPAEVARRLEEVDSERQALIYAGSFTACRRLCERRVLGARRTEWLRAEARAEQVRLLGSPGTVMTLDELHQLLDRPASLARRLVVRGIPRSSVSLASAHNLVIDRDLARRLVHETVDRLREDCDQAAVAPYMPGLPVTVYGFVASDTVIVQRPVLGLVFVSLNDGTIRAPGIIADPPLSPEDQAATIAGAVAAARRIGEELNYRGAFGVDGTLTGSGLVVHDFNPRVCAGFRIIDEHALGDLHPSLLDMTLRESDEPRTLLADLPPRLPTPVLDRPVLWMPDDRRDRAMAELTVDGDMPALLAAIRRVAEERNEEFLDPGER